VLNNPISTGCPINYENSKGNYPSSPLINGGIGSVSELSSGGILEPPLPVIGLIGKLISGKSIFVTGYGKEVVLPVQPSFPNLTGIELKNESRCLRHRHPKLITSEKKGKNDGKKRVNSFNLYDSLGGGPRGVACDCQ